MKKRWEICLECLKAGGPHKDMVPSLNQKAQNIVVLEMNNGNDWFNPALTVWYFMVSNKSGKKVYENNRHALCIDCPFILEHTIAAQKSVQQSCSDE